MKFKVLIVTVVISFVGILLGHYGANQLYWHTNKVDWNKSVIEQHKEYYGVDDYMFVSVMDKESSAFINVEISKYGDFEQLIGSMSRWKEFKPFIRTRAGCVFMVAAEQDDGTYSVTGVQPVGAEDGKCNKDVLDNKINLQKNDDGNVIWHTDYRIFDDTDAFYIGALLKDTNDSIVGLRLDKFIGKE